MLIDQPLPTPCVSCVAGSSFQALFPPVDPTPGVAGEILEERVVSSRGQVKPRGVRRKMSSYNLRKRGPVSREIHDRTPRIVPKCA